MMTTSIFSVISGAEDFHFEGSNIGILLCHGFVGTPQSMRFLGEGFSKAGFTVRAPRLKGHGTHYKDLELATFTDWIKQLEDNYIDLKKQCDEVYIVGQSMGGLLSLLVASRFQDVTGIITINVALEVPGYAQYKNKNIPRYLEEGAPDIKDQSIFEITYPKVPLHAIKQLLSLIDYTTDKLPAINSPLLLFHSTVDNVVPPKSTNYVYDNVSSIQKDIIELKNSYHVASMDYDHPKIISDTISFISEVSTKEEITSFIS